MIDPVVDLTLRGGLAVLFAVAAAHKLRDVGRFASTLGEYRVLPGALVVPAAGVVIAGEVAIAGAVLVPGARGSALAGAAALLLLYAAAIGINLMRGRRHIDCGCAGPAARRPIGTPLVVRNLVLAGVALAALAPVAPRPLVWLDGLTTVAATAALSALYAALDRMVADAPHLARLRGVA
jgi:hypothetical protein